MELKILFESDVSKKGAILLCNKKIGLVNEFSNSSILFTSIDFCSGSSAIIDNSCLSPSFKINLLFLYSKLYLFKTGEFFNVKKLLSFLSLGFLSSIRAFFEPIILVNAKLLSFTIPKSFLMIHDLIFVKDKDFTGLKYIDEIKTLIKIIMVVES